MVHNPIHDALDMGLRVMGGDKKAYRRWKKNRDKENKRMKDIKERNARNKSPDSDRIRSKSTDAVRKSLQPKVEGSVSSPGGLPRQATQEPQQKFKQGRAPSRRPQTPPLRPGYEILSPSVGPKQQLPNSGQPLPEVGSITQKLPPAGSESEVPENEKRVATEFNKIGDMNRTFIEGMLPPDEYAKLQLETIGEEPDGRKPNLGEPGGMRPGLGRLGGMERGQGRPKDMRPHGRRR